MSMTVPVFITLVLGVLAIMSTLIGFGFKIGTESQRNKQLATSVDELHKAVGELDKVVRLLQRRLDRLGLPAHHEPPPPS